MAKSFNERMKEKFALITASYDKANALVHETAMEILRHAKEHKDCSTAQGLVMALPASIRREMLILWFAKFSPIVVKNNADWASKMQPENFKNGEKNPLFVPFDIEGAEATPFFKLAEQNKEVAPALDDQAILQLILRLANSLEKKVKSGDVEPEFVDSTQAVVGQLKKIRIKAKAPANDENANGGNGVANAA